MCVGVQLICIDSRSRQQLIVQLILSKPQSVPLFRCRCSRLTDGQKAALTNPHHPRVWGHRLHCMSLSVTDHIS